MDKQKRRAEPAVAIFRLILAGIMIVSIILDLGPETSMVSLPEKYIYCPGPVRYLQSDPAQREICPYISSRIAPYLAIFCLTNPCSSSFYKEKEQQGKIISAHLAFNNLLQYDRPRIWREIQRQIRDLPVDQMEFAAFWPSREDFAHHSAETQAGVIICSLDLIDARCRNQPAPKEKIKNIGQELEELKSFKVFKRGEYRQRDWRRKNIVRAWLWIKI